MNSHDWSTPLVEFKLNTSLMNFWRSPEATRLRNLIGIKPDKFKGMNNLTERGEAKVLCTPTQFAYIIAEYITHRPVNHIGSLKPKLKMPPEEGTIFDLVHCTSCWFPHMGED